MQRLEVTGAVQPIYESLGVKRLIEGTTKSIITKKGKKEEKRVGRNKNRQWRINKEKMRNNKMTFIALETECGELV